MTENPVAWLRTIILVDVATAFSATIFMLVIRMTVVSSSYLTVAAGMVAAAGVVMAGGLSPLGRGDVRRALHWLAVANWSIAIAAATIATFSWPLMMLTALLPCVLAASIVSGRDLAAYVAISVVVSVAVVLVGILQDFSGLTDAAAGWVSDSVLIVFAPTLVGLVALMVFQNSTTMQAAIDAVRGSRAELAEQAAELMASRARVVAATDRERRRIERDLHDGAQQRLIAIGIGLSQAKLLWATDPERGPALLDSLRQELRIAHDELRDLAQGVYPPVLTEHGLGAALQSAADRSPVAVTVALGPIGRHRREVEAALYFCCVEALQNAIKHAGATSIVLTGGRDDATVWFSVSDDGAGFDPTVEVAGSGVVNICDRLGSIGGRVELVAKPGCGVTLRGSVPISTAANVC